MASPPPFPFIFISFCSFLNSHGSSEGGDKGVEEVKVLTYIFLRSFNSLVFVKMRFFFVFVWMIDISKQ